MLRRLRVKFVCVNMGIVVAMLAVIFGLVIGSTRQNLARESEAAAQTALSGPTMPRFGRGGDIPGRLPYLRVDLDMEGGVSAVEGFVTDPASLPALDGLIAAALAREDDSGILGDWGFRYVRAATLTGTRLVFVDMTSETATLRGLVRTCLIIGAASFVVFFALSLLLARWAVRPVEEAWQRQKQFVSDASHELKTPLTVIMTNAELLQSPDYDDNAKRRFGENILTMARQMRGLTESLLDLARVESGAAADMGEVDLSKLCADAVLPFEPLCYEKGYTLRTDIAAGLRVRGSAARLRQVVEILLDNAQKYAAPGGEIAVTLARNGKRCILSVADEGAAIAPEDLEHLFERFYRADRSRGRDGSYGLGLSIAQKIVTDHGGKIWAASAAGVNTFSVALSVI